LEAQANQRARRKGAEHAIGAGELVSYTDWRMDTEQIIADIEWLERTFAVPDPRPLSPSDLSDANRRHDEIL